MTSATPPPWLDERIPDIDPRIGIRAPRWCKRCPHYFPKGTLALIIDQHLLAPKDTGGHDLPMVDGLREIETTDTPPTDAPLWPGDRYELTEGGNALRFIHTFGQDVRFNHSVGAWLLWDGTRWRRDNVGAIHELAKRFVRLLYTDVARQADAGKDGDALIQHAEASDTKRAMRAMLDLVSTDPTIRVTSDQLDTAPFLVNVQNGTYNVQTSSLQPHSRADLITRICRFPYDPDARDERWDNLLHQMTAGDLDLQAFYRRAIGYGATGSTRSDAAFLLTGVPKSGKSTLLRCVSHTLGDYATPISGEKLAEAHSPDQIDYLMGDLEGYRFVFCIETREGMKLSVNLLKALASGDETQARARYKDSWRVRPTAKVYHATNHPPRTGADAGFWRREKVILTPNSIKDADETIRENLPELAGPAILAWMLAGASEWYREGLQEPEAVVNATKAYQAEENVEINFIEEKLMRDTLGKITAKDLREKYEDYCKETGEKAISAKTLSKRLQAAGFLPSRGKGGTRLWTGLRLLTPEEIGERAKGDGK